MGLPYTTTEPQTPLWPGQSASPRVRESASPGEAGGGLPGLAAAGEVASLQKVAGLLPTRAGARIFRIGTRSPSMDPSDRQVGALLAPLGVGGDVRETRRGLKLWGLKFVCNLSLALVPEFRKWMVE